MMPDFQLFSFDHLAAFKNTLTSDWSLDSVKSRPTIDFSSEDFEHYLLASSLYSSKIEGNTLDVNSFFYSRTKADTPKAKEVEEVENLVSAYRFATGKPLTESNFLKTHKILSKTLLPSKEQGNYRSEQVGIRDAGTLKLVYLAVEPEFVKAEMNKLFVDIKQLISLTLSDAEIVYSAGMLHLWLAKIHPFGDGNGRAARLLEKWFLVSKLGSGAWSILSEKYYWDNRATYYERVALGSNYYALKWERSVAFLQMLTKSIPNGTA